MATILCYFVFDTIKSIEVDVVSRKIIFSNKRQGYWYLFWSFLGIGSISFGGYLALIGMVRERFELRDKLIGDTRIAEAIALASLLPGPMAVNVIAYTGYCVAGIGGAIVSILGVLLPSYLLLQLISILYFEYNSVLTFDSVLIGITPVIIAIILSMAVGMWKKNCTGWREIGLTAGSVLFLLVFNSYWSIVCVIILSGLIGIFLFDKNDKKMHSAVVLSGYGKYVVIIVTICVLYAVCLFYFSNEINFTLFHHFGSASLTLFGGGYVMIPVLKALLVDQLGWITSDDFFLGISLGQMTPGPILISAVFFGYKVNGVAGSIFATAGIFLPSSMLMILASKFYFQISQNRKIEAALRGIKPSIVGLIIFAAFSLTYTNAIFSRQEYMVVLIFIAFLILQKFKINPAVAVCVGGVGGYLFHFFQG